MERRRKGRPGEGKMKRGDKGRGKTDMQRDRQTNRQMERPTDRQTDRQTDSQTLFFSACAYLCLSKTSD